MSQIQATEGLLEASATNCLDWDWDGAVPGMELTRQGEVGLVLPLQTAGTMQALAGRDPYLIPFIWQSNVPNRGPAMGCGLARLPHHPLGEC